MNKQTMKTSEARILILLANGQPNLKFTRAISNKLNIDYGYLIGILQNMVSKEWIKPERQESKIFYSNTKNAPLEKAKEKLTTPKGIKTNIEEE